MMKKALKIIITLILIFSYIVLIYRVFKLKIPVIEEKIVPLLNSIIGDIGNILFIILVINILISLHIFIFKKLKAEKKISHISSIIAIPIYNIVYLWKYDND